MALINNFTNGCLIKLLQTEDYDFRLLHLTWVLFFVISVNELQKKYDPKHPLNLFRKQYGNIYEALKAMKSKPFFDLDSMVIRMKTPDIVRALGIRKDLM